jgi:hypothetical protein
LRLRAVIPSQSPSLAGIYIISTTLHSFFLVYTLSQPSTLLLLSSIGCHLVCVQSRLQIAHSPRSVRFRGSKRPPHSLGKSEYIVSSASQSPFPSIAEIKYESKSHCSIWAGQLLKLHSNTILPPTGNHSTNRCRASSSPCSMASANHSKATGSPRSELSSSRAMGNHSTLLDSPSGLSNRSSSPAMGRPNTVLDNPNWASNNHMAPNSLSSRLTGSQHHHRVTTDSLTPTTSRKYATCHHSTAGTGYPTNTPSHHVHPQTYQHCCDISRKGFD